ncbi:hypothetical protein ACFYO0_14420 [Streptomyces sp. NPDC006365]|uniref:hypothetical protein n=1 Tax=Streptomyces sp. NPDC006365 TaxID=3364744 RepID=UPI0036CED5E1
MNTRLVNSASGVITAAQAQNRTAAGIALALESAQMLMTPETAAEQERIRTERDRYRTAWRMSRTRALSAGGAADRYAARAREGQEALQNMLFATIASQIARKAATDEAAELRARVANLEAKLAEYEQPADTAPSGNAASETTSPALKWPADWDDVLDTAIHTWGGEWDTRRVQRLYLARNGRGLLRSHARGFLSRRARQGLMTLHDRPGARFYTLNSPKGGA